MSTHERPILMSGPMVRAILEGRKTQTRRVVKSDFIEGREFRGEVRDTLGYPASDGRRWFGFRPRGFIFTGEAKFDGSAIYLTCPYGNPGDRLWVRETFFAWRCKIYSSSGISTGPEQCVYRADGGTLLNGAKWKPSIFMPRLLSRITLEITDVRVQRLQEISEEDAIAEGSQTPIAQLPKSCRQAAYSERQAFSRIWESINGHGAWDANPWVWAISFKRI